VILLIEDSKEVNNLHRIIFESLCFTVYAAERLDEARKRLRDTEPDIILMDVELRDGNGFTFCEEIRSQTKAHIIFLTGMSSLEDLARGFAAGGDYYVTKPCRMEELMSRVDAAMRRRRVIGLPSKPDG
jgi:DNA-binding response OmpR family regulator